MARPGRLRRGLQRAALGAAVLTLVSPAVLFFLWMLSLSLKTELENTAYPIVFWPSAPSFANYVAVFEDNPFWRYLGNSLLVSGGAVGVALVLGVPAAWAISQLRSRRLLFIVFMARMTPAISFLIPLFTIFKLLGLSGTLTSVFVAHLVITMPIVVYLSASSFEALPQELDDAARADGASPWQRFAWVALPLTKPGIAVACILAFIFSWNNFIFAAVLAGREQRTLPVAVYNSLSFEVLSWGPLAAAALMVTLPVLIVTLLLQQRIVAGLTAGAVKGG